MKRTNRSATFADILVMAIVVLICPTSPVTPYHPFCPPQIPDKVEVHYTRPSTTDSLHHIEAKLAEMDYYFKVHNVTDEGYNQVARYQSVLRAHKTEIARFTQKTRTVRMAAKDRPLVAVKMPHGYWKAGHFHLMPYSGRAITRDRQGRIVSAIYRRDSVVTAIRIDSVGIYEGQMDAHLQASGEGIYVTRNGDYHEGFWLYDQPHGFGFRSSPSQQLRIGEWKAGRYLGERMKYTSERIYGIDISRHQHEKGRKRFPIDWRRVRITSLGARHNAEGQTFPVSFVYIKSTEGTTIRNRYFLSDYTKAKKQGIRVGAYHFFSLKSPAAAQANYFVNHTLFRKGDFPPVLDVEPTDGQIQKIGGDDALMQRIRTFMDITERRTGMRPILYVSQSFINRHMNNAADIKQRHNVWIARYGQFRPDVKLVYWQLCPDGKVDGITGPVDINVFNGYQMQFDEFSQTGFYK